MRVSAIVVSFRSQETIGRCLESIREVAEEGEILVVDNDGASRREIESRFPWTRVLDGDPGIGFGAANNRAAARADGEALLLINPDAWLEPGAMRALTAALAEDSRRGLVAPRLLYPDGTPQYSWVPTTSIVGEALQKMRSGLEARPWAHSLLETAWRPFDPGWYSAACLLVRRQAFDAIGGFDERYFLYFEDVDLCLRMRQAGWRLTQAAEARCVHRKGGSQTAGAAEVAYRESQLRYYEDHRPRWEQRWIRRRLRRRAAGCDDETRRRLEVLLEKRERPGRSSG